MFDSGSFDWLILLLLLPTIKFSLEHKQPCRKQHRKKWKRSDSSDSDSVELMSPLSTAIFDFSHLAISSLTTPSTISTTTPSPLKTNLKGSYSSPWRKCEGMKGKKPLSNVAMLADMIDFNTRFISVILF